MEVKEGNQREREERMSKENIFRKRNKENRIIEVSELKRKGTDSK